MISATQIPLTEGKNEAIRSWLRKPELRELVEIVEAKQKTCEARMTNLATESNTYPVKIAEANEEIFKAGRYVTFLSVLKELQDQTEPFTHVKLT